MRGSPLNVHRALPNELWWWALESLKIAWGCRPRLEDHFRSLEIYGGDFVPPTRFNLWGKNSCFGHFAAKILAQKR